jgi:HD-GYP domain-containing protein (c-di-GMP phosphodiesterase class II)
MTDPTRLRIFVGVVAGVSLLSVAIAWQVRLPFPGYWDVGSFLLIALLLEQLITQLRVGAAGSTSFVMHLSAGILFGGFWGATVAASSMAVSQVLRRLPPIKVIFNVSQLALAVSSGLLVYQYFGGSFPPEYLRFTGSVAAEAVRRDLILFFVFAACYFGVNSLAVSAAVSLSTGQRLRDVWNLNTRGVLGYDLGASVMALLVAWFFVKAQEYTAIGSLGLVLVIAPIIVVRHVYGMYHRLQESGRELLDVMVKAIEARDPYTSGHSIRVRDLSRTIAVELGLSIKEVDLVETAALLHDVGKIHEEFAPLLRKEARLTPEETALMQTHAAKSADLVGIISKFRGFIQESVRHHHERWDGKGYPNGLQGTDIPLGSRIILISDTIDAMTTDRPYRKRLGLDIVVAELQKCKGTQFDPEIVEVAISSVAVRRLIAHGSALAADSALGTDSVPRSRRVSWPSGRLWRTRRA